ncbi:MAG: hypothetical protein ACJAR6_001468 [Oleispira sp.]
MSSAYIVNRQLRIFTALCLFVPKLTKTPANSMAYLKIFISLTD